MNVKLDFDTINVFEATNPNYVKVLMLKGEKGDPGGIVNEYSNSTSDAYSANYINNHKETAIQNTQPTGGQGVWIKDSKNLIDGLFRQGSKNSTTSATRIFSKQNYYVEQNVTYTISTTLNTSSYKYAINIATAPFPITGDPFYDSGWKTTSSFTFTPSQSGYLGIVVATSNGTDNLTPTSISSATWQLEVGSSASTYQAYISNPSISVKRDDNSYKEIYNKDNMGDLIVDSITGKNLFDEYNNISRILVSDAGTEASNNQYLLSDYIKVTPSTTYILSYSGTDSVARIVAYNSSKTFISRTLVNSGSTYTTDGNTQYVKINYNTSYVSQLMFEKGSTVTNYIKHKEYGYNSEESMKSIIVDDISCKNLFDKDNANVIVGYITSTDISTSNEARTIYIPCKSNTTYTISKIQSARFRIGTTTTTPAVGTSISNYVNNDNGTSITITTSTTARYLCAFIYHSNYDTQITLQDILNSIQIEKGSEATNYTPYKTFDNSESEIYSTNEIKIGRWINGKPLYQTVVETTMPTISTNGTYPANKNVTFASNVKFSFIDNAIMTVYDDNYTLPYINNAGYIAKAFTTNNVLNITGNGTGYSEMPIKAIIKYTKTTD